MSAAQYATQLDEIGRRVELPPRFWAKVDKNGPNGCWVWTAAATTAGYGSFRVGPKAVYPHRLSYEAHVGPIPAEFVIDHLCRNRACVNPEHLEVVTQGENARRGLSVGYHVNAPQRCRRGHDWAEFPPLIVHRSDGRISRQCSVCDRARQLRRRTKKAAS